MAALIGSAALGVHESRYLLAYGGRSGEELARQGHAYVSFVTPLVAGLMALAAVQLLTAVTRARDTGTATGVRPPLWKLWLFASAALLSIYVGQELLEGVLAAGHAQGVAAVFAHGGWVCAPLALGFGALAAVGLRGAELAVSAAARRAMLRRPERPTPGAPRLPAQVFARASSPLAAKLAGRAPPLLR